MALTSVPMYLDVFELNSKQEVEILSKMYKNFHLEGNNNFDMIIWGIYHTHITNFCKLDSLTSALHAYWYAGPALFWTTWNYVWGTLPWPFPLHCPPLLLWRRTSLTMRFSQTSQSRAHTPTTPLNLAMTFCATVHLLYYPRPGPKHWDSLYNRALWSPSNYPILSLLILPHLLSPYVETTIKAAAFGFSLSPVSGDRSQCFHVWCLMALICSSPLGNRE